MSANLLTDDLLERFARTMHEKYEDAAAHYGWATNPRSRVPWEDLPAANRATMLAAIIRTLDDLGDELVTTVIAAKNAAIDRLQREITLRERQT